MKMEIFCDWCGKPLLRYPSQVKNYNFCCRACLGHFASKTDNPEGYRYRDFSKNAERFTELNIKLNPSRMIPGTRMKLRSAHLGSENGLTYEKFLGRHTHRVVAELMLGRPLRPEEVVHHKDRDRRNNQPENLEVFPSQAAHSRWHKLHDKGGDAL